MFSRREFTSVMSNLKRYGRDRLRRWIWRMFANAGYGMPALTSNYTPLRPLCAADQGGMEGWPMNEFGEPNMGNPSVRFDEGGRELVIGLTPFNPSSPAYSA